MRLIESPLCQELTRQGRRHSWMAERLGVRPWTFSRIEAGVQPAPADWYERAAALLGVTTDDITPKDAIAA